MVLVKIGRDDFLIASHLAFELFQLNIVIQMLIRDTNKSTNIHRFGEKEDVPVLKSLLQSDINELSDKNTANVILHMLFLAAEQMDGLLLSLNIDYSPKSGRLKSIRQKLKFRLDEGRI
jgi:hypothetical protein